MHSIKRALITTLITSSVIIAQELSEVEVYAKNVTYSQKGATLKGGVVVEYKGDILSGKSAIYDKESNKLILKESTIFISKSGRKIKAKELTINLENNNLKFKNFFEIDKKDIWIYSKIATKNNKVYNLENALFSSCSIDNPDWLLGFEKATYNTNSKKLELSNVKLYIKDIPILYIPYIPLYLSKERRSGLLIPTFASMNNEGYMYEQPYFWAISKSQDLEFNPQIRTKRGYGLYMTYRFYHAKDAYGKIRVGYFKDKQSYTKKYNLKYNEHYGVEIDYVNNSFFNTFSTDGYENKLYFNAIYFSDIDYINLQNKNKFSHKKVGSFYESRLNYFLRNNYFYSGIGFRYFKSDNTVSNKKTIQILPNLHFHLPYTNIIFNNLSYSADLAITNYTRQKGTKALRVKFKIPLELHFSLFNNYLNLNITQELESSGYDFYNVPIEQKKYSSIVLNSKVELSSELTKIYSSGIHTAFYSLAATKSKIIDERWMKYDEIPKELKSDFVDDIPFNTKITFRTHQYWKSFSSGFNINYILESHYFLKKGRFRDLNQELNLNYKNWNFYSQFGYSFLHKQTTGIYNKIGYNTATYGLYFSYLWKKDYLSFETISKEIGIDGYYNFKNFKLRAKASYNLKDRYLKNWEIGGYYDRKCWGVDLSFGQDIKPVIKKDSSRGSIKNNYIKFELTIKPFGTI